MRDRDSKELCAVAPLVVLGPTPELVGTATLVAHAGKTLAVTSAELVRPCHGKQLVVMTSLDGSAHLEVSSIGMGRYAGIALLELASAVPALAEVAPLSLGHVCATSNTRGAPAALVRIVETGGRYQRTLIPVDVDEDDGGGMSDTISRLASPIEPPHVDLDVEGTPLFAWFPPNPALGRKSEVLLVAIAYPYRVRTAKPRDLPVFAELVPLDDLGRALIAVHEPDQRPELAQVAGEIVDEAEVDPLAGLDE